MKHEDWSARWREGRTAFHQAEANDLLVRYAERAWGHQPRRRVLVPLCGKSLDLVYLASRAESVVGVEFVVQAVVDFFASQSLEPAVDAGPPRRYTADRYTLFAADFFSVGGQEVGEVDAAFDRAALVALPAETRPAYAARLAELLSPGARLLLVSYEYDESRMEGPPFSVPASEVHALFGGSFEIEFLESRDGLTESLRERGLDSVQESAFVLTRS